MMLAGAQIVEQSTVAYSPGGAVSVPVGLTAPAAAPAPPQQPPALPESQGLARVPSTEPVDINFSNITCTVKLGINKGKPEMVFSFQALRSVLS